MNQDYSFKVVCVGNSGVGKTSSIIRYADDKFETDYLATIGVDFKFKTTVVNGKKVKIQIWDTAGQERFRTITGAYYKNADAVIIFYDITDKESFDAIDQYWLEEINYCAKQGTQLMLIGNKLDLDQDRQIQTNLATIYAKKHNMIFSEISAKQSQNINDAFKNLIESIMQNKIMDPNIKQSGILNQKHLKNFDYLQKKQSCC